MIEKGYFTSKRRYRGEDCLDKHAKADPTPDKKRTHKSDGIISTRSPEERNNEVEKKQGINRTKRMEIIWSAG